MIGAFGRAALADPGFVRAESNSFRIQRSQIASFEASLAHIYSASVVDRAIRLCFLAFQEIAVW